jgi:molybdopterin molybdotransferase
MLSLEEARERILAAIQPLPPESVCLTDALGRFAAESVPSPIDLPPADNCAMDGYALRAQDSLCASAGAPVALRVLGRAPAGKVFEGEVHAGGCVRVFTGSVLPRGADAVAMQEDAALAPGQPGRVLIVEPVRPWENVRFRGEDVKQNEALVEAGDKLRAACLSLLAAAGIVAVRCGRRPVAGLVATGSELREPGQPLEPGAIFESNRIGLAALARQTGAIPKIYPLVGDDLCATKVALQRALGECDVVVTSGGVSVGELDLVRTAFAEIGGQVDFWSVALRPGKPFAFGRCGGKCLFGVPGNPVSALVTFFLLVAPALLRLQQAREVYWPTCVAKAAQPLVNSTDRRHFMRVRLHSDGTVRPSGAQASHVLSTAAKAEGLVDVPPRTTFAAGASVAVLRWD